VQLSATFRARSPAPPAACPDAAAGTGGREGTKAGTVRGYDDVTYRLSCPEPSEYSNCATCLDGCPQDTVTCMASCLMTDGNAICKEPYC
jgi:hypothetical protein